ncbi:hypothetical protein PoB_006100200 [Plakobranchus ocellatus]|uniref:Uncharacterized protein n=1 Tax=Plakobranchus ocellatus TaxID=259542 RepID=A0AAV4CRJ3_9GAST|nr:hypothetical protein PoB_006100200 [Plakobranchus ocellatus]
MIVCIIFCKQSKTESRRLHTKTPYRPISWYTHTHTHTEEVGEHIHTHSLAECIDPVASVAASGPGSLIADRYKNQSTYRSPLNNNKKEPVKLLVVLSSPTQKTASQVPSQIRPAGRCAAHAPRSRSARALGEEKHTTNHTWINCRVDWHRPSGNSTSLDVTQQRETYTLPASRKVRRSCSTVHLTLNIDP